MIKYGLLAIAMLLMSSCHHLDDDRIPPAPVRIVFNTVSDWDIYGPPGAATSKSYIKSLRQPAIFPFTALTETGFGGVLLCCDVYGAPVAYDLSCPVEIRADVRIAVDEKELIARCPKCHSEYDVFSNYGNPISGPAADRGYGLRRYYVGAGPSGEYMIVKNY
ncbi:MAG: hypothetical protein NC311_17690 [Muribaculaceae bacterium]|nr:hypothetical protein [Muribaculaceae bacterium]